MPDNNFQFSGYLEPEEVRSIINTVPRVSRHAERDQLLLELLWQSGSRVSESITLVPERIGMTSVVLQNLKQYKRVKSKVPGEQPTRVSNPTAMKEVEVSAQLCIDLKAFCDKNRIPEGEYVFHADKGQGHMRRWYVWKMITKASEEARVYRFGKRNIRTGGRFKGAFPHLLRHSSGMAMLEETSNIALVQKQLGHASVQTTQIYAYVKEKNIKKAISKINWYKS